jgi:hypothetical protein
MTPQAKGNSVSAEWKRLGRWFVRSSLLVPTVCFLQGDVWRSSVRPIGHDFPVAEANSDKFANLRARLEDFSSDFPECAVSVKDPYNDKVVYSHLSEKQFSAASTVKSMIAYALVRSVEQGRTSLDQTISVRLEHLAPGSGIGLREGDYKLAYLMQIMITDSDNSAANALIDQFANEIQSVINELGLDNTEISRFYFSDDPNGRIVTSAGDLTQFYREIYLRLKQPSYSPAMQLFYEAFVSRKFSLLSETPGRIYIGKYGQNDSVEGDAGIIYMPDTALAIALLCPAYNYRNQFEAFSDTLR